MVKLAKKEIPANHTLDDFECFGPPAQEDGNFSDCKIADLGCFDQELKSSNKFYHGAIVKSKKNGKYFTYFEWGRLGNTSNEFQFQECESEGEAQKLFEKQIHSKNDKRGEWYNHPQLGKMLRAKSGKDCYLIRNQAVRITGLPDAKRLCSKVSVGTISNKFDSETTKLIQDLKAGNIAYTKGMFSGNFVPDILAINKAKDILSAVTKTKIEQEKVELTRALYSIIPKVTKVGEKIQLDNDNIKAWSDDLDAFEDSYNNLSGNTSSISLKYELRYVDKSNQLFYTIDRMVESATRNRHAYIPGKMKLLNVWEVTNTPDWFVKKQEEVSKQVTVGNKVPVIFQPERTELEKASNTYCLFHGSRSCNIGGIVTTGFRLPKHLNGVAINGSLYGSGTYFADDWKKSAGYCSIKNGYWSKGDGFINNRKAFMFLNDVILGNPKMVKSTGDHSNLSKEFHSVAAVPQNTSVQNSEFIVYTIEMFYPKYLLEFDI